MATLDYMGHSKEWHDHHLKQNPRMKSVFHKDYWQHLEGIEEADPNPGDPTDAFRFHVTMNNADLYSIKFILENFADRVDFVSEDDMNDPRRTNQFHRIIDRRDVRLLDLSKYYAKFAIEGTNIYSMLLSDFVNVPASNGEHLVDGKTYKINPRVFLESALNMEQLQYLHYGLVQILPNGKLKSWNNRVVYCKIEDIPNRIMQLPSEAFMDLNARED